jgi:hypothetical protein
VTIQNAWANLARTRLARMNPAPDARWHRASQWWSLQLDGAALYVLFLCDDGRIHVHWRSTSETLHAEYPSIVARTTQVGEGVTFVVELQPNAIEHPSAAAFMDALLTRTNGFV